MKGMQKVAAVQVQLEIGRPSSNIDKCLSKLETAFRQGAKFVALPEFISTPICLADGVEQGVLPPNNALLKGLINLCQQYGAAAGGSYLERRGGEVFNTYAFVDNLGIVFKHDKDMPTMVESAFYKGGATDRLLGTASGRVGVAMCWEMIRTRTVRRLVNQVDLIMAGTHWWTEPGWRFPRRLLEIADRRNHKLLRHAPSRLARMTGAPVIHSSQIGNLRGRFALSPSLSLPMTTRLLGETQIVNARGEVIAALSDDQGEGIIYAQIEIGNSGATLQPHGEFWSSSMPWETRVLWAQQNAACRNLYKGL